jgi:hypothetical protein
MARAKKEYTTEELNRKTKIIYVFADNHTNKIAEQKIVSDMEKLLIKDNRKSVLLISNNFYSKEKPLTNKGLAGLMQGTFRNASITEMALTPKTAIKLKNAVIILNKKFEEEDYNFIYEADKNANDIIIFKNSFSFNSFELDNILYNENKDIYFLIYPRPSFSFNEENVTSLSFILKEKFFPFFVSQFYVNQYYQLKLEEYSKNKKEENNIDDCVISDIENKEFIDLSVRSFSMRYNNNLIWSENLDMPMFDTILKQILEDGNIDLSKEDFKEMYLYNK